MARRCESAGTEVAVLASLGLEEAEIEELLQQGASAADAWHLIRDLGCPPKLATDILLWAAEVESATAGQTT
ncbi:MAG: hypothetical protein NZL88_06050 [Gaiellaceae bacterium]|nr:hypothetical protein [Gaiellaceae bacterium]